MFCYSVCIALQDTDIRKIAASIRPVVREEIDTALQTYNQKTTTYIQKTNKTQTKAIISLALTHLEKTNTAQNKAQTKEIISLIFVYIQKTNETQTNEIIGYRRTCCHNSHPFTSNSIVHSMR